MSMWLEDIQAAWLGKIIGVRLGAPVENWSAQQIKSSFGKIEDFVKEYPVFGADDDTNGPLYFTRVLLDNDVRKITSQDIADTMLNVIADEHGFFWWGGVGVSTEHTMYHNLKNGLSALKSGSSTVNGKELSEQIGGQIFSDGWAYVAYDDVGLAVDLASKAASVSHDGEAIEGAKFVSAAISLAFTYKDIFEVMNRALEHCDQQSEYVRVARDVIALSRRSEHWERTLEYIHQEYPYVCYGGICPIIPNMAVMVMAMAHGNQNFRDTLLICVNAGWDTDCNVGNVGSIMGALVGINGIYMPWIHRINDVCLSSGLLGSINMTDATQQALYFGKLAHTIQPMLSDGRLIAENDFSFGLPHSTHGFSGRWHRYFDGTHVNVPMIEATFQRALQLNVHGAYPQASVEIIKKTYFRANEVYDSRYEPSLAPVVWPGQTICTRLKAEKTDFFTARLLVRDLDGNVGYSDATMLTCNFESFQMEIPSHFSLITEIGVELICQERTFLTNVWMDDVNIKGSANFDWDVTKLPMEDYGMTFTMGNHKEIAGCTHVNGDWIVAGGITCLSMESSMLLFGDVRWGKGIFDIDIGFWGVGSAVCFAVRGANQYIEIVRKSHEEFHINMSKFGKRECLLKVFISHVKSAQISLHIECVSHIIIFKVNDNILGKLCMKGVTVQGSLGFISSVKEGLSITGIRVSNADFNINEEET
jgi:ADP-ribosylglycohydrolase